MNEARIGDESVAQTLDIAALCDGCRAGHREFGAEVAVRTFAALEDAHAGLLAGGERGRVAFGKLVEGRLAGDEGGFVGLDGESEKEREIGLGDGLRGVPIFGTEHRLHKRPIGVAGEQAAPFGIRVGSEHAVVPGDGLQGERRARRGVCGQASARCGRR